jgi:hypothetical protein
VETSRVLLFGEQVESELPFSFPMISGVDPAGLRVRLLERAPLPEPAGAALFRSPLRTPLGESIFAYYRLERMDLLRFPGLADFYLSPGEIGLLPAGDDWQRRAEIQLLGTALAFWLERRGLPALHASAVAQDGQAVAFLAANKGGKSSLAAAFMQAGWALLTDDVLPLERSLDGLYRGRPGYPCMRFWPVEARFFCGRVDDLAPVLPGLAKRRAPVGEAGFGRFCPTPQPLACIYRPVRRSGDVPVSIQALEPRQAFLELVSASFIPRLVQAAGLSPRRMQFLAGLLEQTPVRRLEYPSGFEHLPAVRRAVLEDLALRN